MSIEPNSNLMASIIIPVYQAKETLRKCVESCLAQREISREEYEIILVDDGSNDGSDVICDELSGTKSGTKVSVVHTVIFEKSWSP